MALRAALIGCGAMSRAWLEAAAGIDGLFLEVHDDPANAKSDGANALDLKLLKPLLETLLAIHSAAGA